MRAKVTEQGVVIPKQWLEGVTEVEIRRENNLIILVPIQDNDPIFSLGTEPVDLDVTDASTNHDVYIVTK
jgi:virulence-associated protein VagC